VSLGLGWALGADRRWSVDVYELGLFVNRRYGYTASTGEAAANYFQGDYKTFVNMVGVGLGYRW
jgi:hypothetical protein